MEALEQAAGRDLTGHDRGAGAEVLECLEHLAELAHEERAAFGCGKGGDELGEGFLVKGDQAQGNPGPADGRGDEHRVEALAGDEYDGPARIVLGGEKRGRRGHGLIKG